MNLAERAAIAAWANLAGRQSRRSGAPTLTTESPRETLIAWLAWNDANGVFSDESAESEGNDPLTLDDAWTMLADAMRDDAPYTWHEPDGCLLEPGWYTSDDKGRRGPFGTREEAVRS